MVVADIWTPLLAFLGASVGGFITLIGQHQIRRLRSAKQNLTLLCDQVSSFYELEKHLVEEAHRANPDVSAQTIKQRGRKWLVDHGKVKIEVTALKAESIKRRWDRIN